MAGLRRVNTERLDTLGSRVGERRVGQYAGMSLDDQTGSEWEMTAEPLKESAPPRRPLRWRFRLRLNRLRRRGEGYCWWCGSAWNGERCNCCGAVVLASGKIKPMTYE
jgi:hypothetical protein